MSELNADAMVPGMGGKAAAGHPYVLHNRRPTPQDLLELSSRIYKSTRKLYAEADSQGMRVYHDELLHGDVRLVMLVPAWFPRAHVAFDWARVAGGQLSVVFVLRGTMQDLVGNTRANLQLIYNKLVDDQHLPDTATDAVKVMRAWLHTLLLRHPQLDAAAAAAGGSSAHPPHHHHPQQQQQQQQQLRLDVHVTGHSLGGLLAEVASVESTPFAAAHGVAWSCTSFESPGLPDLYYDAALRIAPQEHWREAMTSYLAAPNVINMLYRHLGRIVHVVVPWEQTWTYVAKCVGADVARVTAWAIVGGMVLAGAKQLPGVARRRVEDEASNGAAAAAGQLVAQTCDARVPEHLAAAAGRSTAAAATAAAASLNASAGPAVPEFIIVHAATPSAAADAAGAVGRRLLSTTLPPPAAGAAAAAAAAQPAAAPAFAAAVGAAAAAGEAAASFGGARLVQGVLRRSGLGTLATALGGWMFGRGGVWGVMECLAGVLGCEIEELCLQHGLSPMRCCFDPLSGGLKPRYQREMASWPHLGCRGKVIVTAAKQVAKWTLPSFVCRDNVGVANILSRTAMVEARCARLEGYVVLADTEELRAALASEEVGAPVGELDAAAAAAGLTLPLLDAATDIAAEASAREGQQQQQLEAAGEDEAAAAAAGAMPRALRILLHQQQQAPPFGDAPQQQHHHHHHQGHHHAAAGAPLGLGLGLARGSGGHHTHARAGATAAAAAAAAGFGANPALMELHSEGGGGLDDGPAGDVSMFEADAVVVQQDAACAEGLPMEADDLDDGGDGACFVGPAAVMQHMAVSAGPSGGFIQLQGGAGLRHLDELVVPLQQQQQRSATSADVGEQLQWPGSSNGAMQLHLA